MEFNATFNNISVISWRSVLLMEKTGVPGVNHRPPASHWQRHNVSSSPHWAAFKLTTLVLISTDCLGSCKFWLEDHVLADQDQRSMWDIAIVFCPPSSSVCKLFTFQSSFSKPLIQMEFNLACFFHVWPLKSPETIKVIFVASLLSMQRKRERAKTGCHGIRIICLRGYCCFNDFCLTLKTYGKLDRDEKYILL